MEGKRGGWHAEGFGNFAGDRFRLQSEWQGSAGANFRLPLGDKIELFANPNVTHRSSVFFELPNNPVTSQGPVTLVNLRAGVRDQKGKWEVIGFANNLFDQYPSVNPVGRTTDPVTGQPGNLSVNNYFLPFSSFSPFGFNGRFFYGRVSFIF